MPIKARCGDRPFEIAYEPVRHPGAYDFGTSDLPLRLRDTGLKLKTRLLAHPARRCAFPAPQARRPVPARGGVRARVDVAALAAPWLG